MLDFLAGRLYNIIKEYPASGIQFPARWAVAHPPTCPGLTSRGG